MNRPLNQRLEEIDFKPRLAVVRLIFIALVFSFFAWLLVHDTRARLEFTPASDPAFIFEKIVAAFFLFAIAGFLASYALLPFRLKFTEAGLARRTLWPPRFIPWGAVQSAQIARYKGYFALELWVSRRRWVTVPLLDYGRSASLFAELQSRLPVPVTASDRDLALLSDD